MATKVTAKTPKRARKLSSRATSAKKAAQRKARPHKYAALEKQWQLPAGYCTDGTTLASLADVVDPQTPTLSLSELTPTQRAELIAKRIAAQTDFELAMLGAGLVNKERAIAEVNAQSKVGKVLMQIEQKMISNLIEQAQQRAAQAKAPAKRGKARSK